MISKKCRATCSSDSDKTTESIEPGLHPHSHPPSTTEELKITQTKQQVVHTLKVRALQCKDAPSSVTSDVLGPCSDEVMEVLPMKDSCRRIVARERPAMIAPKDIHFEVSCLIFKATP